MNTHGNLTLLLTGSTSPYRDTLRECRLPFRSRPPAFTRLELLTALAGLALLAGVALPGLASPRARSERVVCVNNLRQIGQALQAWAADHFDRTPWWVSTSQGGTQFHPLASQAWVQFAFISNHLDSPRLLACPADSSAKSAQNWSGASPWGFASAAMRNNAVSYLVGLHAFLDYPQSLLAGDRHLRCNAISQTCSTGVRNVALLSEPWTWAAWTNALHGDAGNFLLSSGEVRQLATFDLPAALKAAVAPFGQIHLLLPR